MKFTAVAAFFLGAVAQLVAAAPLVARDVFVPKIISPDASTVWKAGETVKVTWDASNAPASISNRASVVLRDIDQKYLVYLAQNFDLRTGSIEVTVPANATASDNYFITLFGDSGNVSPNFKVTA